jgi:hypothetical protein
MPRSPRTWTCSPGGPATRSWRAASERTASASTSSDGRASRKSTMASTAVSSAMVYAPSSTGPVPTRLTTEVTSPSGTDASPGTLVPASLMMPPLLARASRPAAAREPGSRSRPRSTTVSRSPTRRTGCRPTPRRRCPGWPCPGGSWRGVRCDRVPGPGAGLPAAAGLVSQRVPPRACRRDPRGADGGRGGGPAAAPPGRVRRRAVECAEDAPPGSGSRGRRAGPGQMRWRWALTAADAASIVVPHQAPGQRSEAVEPAAGASRGARPAAGTPRERRL